MRAATLILFRATRSSRCASSVTARKPSPPPDDRGHSERRRAYGLDAEISLFAQGQANLAKYERDLYRWILPSFGAGRPPSLADLSEQTARLQLDRDRPWSEWRPPTSSVETRDSGSVSVAYPFAPETVDGHDDEAEILSLPEAMASLIDCYKRFPDKNPDWDEYRERMRREKRVLIRIELQRAGPDRQG